MRSRVYAYLDLEHPAVAWATMRGLITSASYSSENSDAGFVSFMYAGMLRYQNNSRLFNESIIEIIRQSSFTHQTSRLRGMYFFRTKQEAQALAGARSWPPYFIPNNLVSLELRSPSLGTIVDANWITFAPLQPDNRLSLSDLSWISRYWSGEAYNSTPVWELIAEGVAVVRDEQVRRRSFDLAKKTFPKAHIPILMARLAGEAGSRGGQISPFLLHESDMRYRLDYITNDGDFHQAGVIASIAKHPDSGALARMMHENETWNLPDFRPWARTFDLGSQSSTELTAFKIASVHHVDSA